MSHASFVDATAHRAALPAVYNDYALIDRDPDYDRTREAEFMILRPLFSLSFFLADFLREAAFFGARMVLISSASSKTAIGLAYMLAQGGPKDVTIVGLTSPRNAAFVAGCGHYDRVVAYGDLEELPADVPAVFVDIAGDAKLLAAVHGRWQDQLKYTSLVGATHWDAEASAAALPGPKPVFFFTPSQIVKRRQDWGPDVLRARQGEAWRGFAGDVGRWLRIERQGGLGAIEKVYQDALAGRSAPDTAHVLALET